MSTAVRAELSASESLWCRFRDLDFSGPQGTTQMAPFISICFRHTFFSRGPEHALPEGFAHPSALRHIFRDENSRLGHSLFTHAKCAALAAPLGVRPSRNAGELQRG
jgi:hypothetical protein